MAGRQEVVPNWQSWILLLPTQRLVSGFQPAQSGENGGGGRNLSRLKGRTSPAHLKARDLLALRTDGAVTREDRLQPRP